jgi:predicted dehydrogenase
MALYLFGAPSAVSATGFEDLANQVDTISAQLFYPSFAVTISGGWHHEGYPFSMEYTVTAQNGTMEYHVRDPKPTLYQRGQAPGEFPATHSLDGYQAEIEYFVSCARSNTQPKMCLPQDSARAVRLAQLILDSRTRKGETLSCQI